MKNDGQRFVTFSTYQEAEGKLGILYHFDKDLEDTHLRLVVDMDKPIPSVSGVSSARCWWKTKSVTSGTSNSTVWSLTSTVRSILIPRSPRFPWFPTSRSSRKNRGLKWLLP